MAKYNHNQLLEIMGACVEFIQGKIDYESAENIVQTTAENYPIRNLKREISQAKKYLSGKGAYGFSYPANWAKAFIEITNNNPSVINALKEQQHLYFEKNGVRNKKLEKVINDVIMPIEKTFNLQNQLVLDLHMSPNGFVKASEELKRLNNNSPQVYVHVGAEGNLKNQVLRIGKAISGAHIRWMTSTNGHKNTFFWSIGESKDYTRENAEKYPNYLLFFASLFGLNTRLYVLTFKTKEEAESCEKDLIKHYDPVWEQLKKVPNTNRNYPFLTGRNKNKEIVAVVARLGAANKVIQKQRNGNNPFPCPIQDLVNMNLRSLRTW